MTIKITFKQLFFLGLIILTFIVWKRWFSPNRSDGRVEQPVMVTKLNIPWEIAFLGDQQLLVTERSGRLVLLTDGASRQTVPGVARVGEGGLLGLSLHPDFVSNSYIYLYYTFQEGEQIFNKVVRFRWQSNKLTDAQVIVNKIPGADNHDGGRIAFGPDGKLYITTGDALQPSLAQNLNSLAGKILRVNDDGSIPTDNPFPGSLVYSYGHRNPQGLAWDSQGRLWSTEHGQNNHDEINLIAAGQNYGWPVIEGNEERVGMVKPVIESGLETWAPSGAVFYDSQLYFTGLAGRSLYRFSPETGQLQAFLTGEFGRLRSISLGPDDHFYLITSNLDGRNDQPSEDDDRLIRILPDFLIR